MTQFIPQRLRKPVVITLAGVLFAAAWLVRGGPLWWVSIMAIVVTAVRAITWYRMSGSDTDEGALAGSRADERQQLLSLRSRALACNVAAIAAFIGLTVAVALNAGWWWPFAAMLVVTGFGYLFGLSSYGSDESDADASPYYASPSVRR
jgi:hypothetical protein